MYEYSIVCTMCESVKSQGGFDAPVNFSNAEVLAHAVHNPGCHVQENANISGTTDGSVQRYQINL